MALRPAWCVVALAVTFGASTRPKQERIRRLFGYSRSLESKSKVAGLDVAAGEQTRSCTFGGYFTPTDFARADTHDPNSKEKKWKPSNATDPTKTTNMKEGRSDIMSAQSISNDFKVCFESGWKDDERHNQFLSVMEAQWEGRQTQNALHADAVIGFLMVNTNKGENIQDGSKSTLNIFAHGRYAHPLLHSSNDFNFGSSNVKKLNEENHVGFKLLEPNNNRDAFCYPNQWEESSNGRFFDVPNTDRVKTTWRDSMQDLANKQYAIGQRNVPILAIWLSKDVTSDDKLALIAAVTKFLATHKPKRLMFTGKRSDEVAFHAHGIMQQALTTITSNIHLVTGYADGVDSIALDLGCVAGSGSDDGVDDMDIGCDAGSGSENGRTCPFGRPPNGLYLLLLFTCFWPGRKC